MIRDAFTAFFNDPASIALYYALVVALADFVSGVLAAWRDGTFQLDSVGAWIRKHVAGRLGGIAMLVLFGYFGRQDALLAAGVAAAGLYTAETAASIITSWGPKREVQKVPTD